MPFDWTQAAGILIVFLGALFLFVQLRFGPSATKEVRSGTELRKRISGSRYTLVQLFAPL